MVAVAAASRRRACRRWSTPGCERLEADRRKLLGIILEVRDVELVEPAGADRLDADRDVLEILLALVRGDDDLGLVRRPGRPARPARPAVSPVTFVALVPARATGSWRSAGRSVCAKAGDASAVEASSPKADCADRPVGHRMPPFDLCVTHCGRARRACQRPTVASPSIFDMCASVAERRGHVRIGVEDRPERLASADPRNGS